MNSSSALTRSVGIVALAFFAALWIARWPSFPLVLDPYYHLFIARQIVEANGPLAYEWWEYAPVGRPHLYPPVLHLGLALLLKLGISPITVIRLATAILPPVLMLVLFWVVRRLQGEETASAVALVALLPFSFHVQMGITLASSVGMILALGLVYAIEQHRVLAGGLLLGLLFYTHLGLPWLMLFALGSMAWMRPELRKTALRSLWGLGLALPWLWHLSQYRGVLGSFPRYENKLLELLPLLWLLGLGGAAICLKRSSVWRWPLALAIGFLPLLFHHRFRWFCGEGVLPLLWLSGIGFCWCAEKLSLWSRIVKPALFLLLLVALLILAPSVGWQEGRWQWRQFDSGPWHLAGISVAPVKTTEGSLYAPPMQALADAVVQHTRPMEILWSNAPYALGLIAALAQRPMASAMLNEVKAPYAFDPVQAAQVFVWFKIASGDGFPSTRVLNRRTLKPVAETEIATLLRGADAVPLARPPQAVMPLRAAWVALGLILGVIVWDLRRSTRSSTKTL